MKKAAYGLMAAFFASGVGGMPPSAADWYTPSGGFSRQSGGGTVYFIVDGEERTAFVSVDEEGMLSGGINFGSETTPELKTSYEALVKACANEAWNAMQDEAIITIGENLNAIGLSAGIEVTATDPNGGTHTYTMGFSGGSLQKTVNDSGKISVTDPSRAYNHADERTLHWNAGNRVELYGSDSATSSYAEWWDDCGFSVPFLKGSGALAWKKYGGFDDTALAAWRNGDRTVLTLRGWRDGSAECATTLEKILTDDDGGDRAAHAVLTRYTTGTGGVEFHYVPFGDRLEAGGAAVDGVSVTTNVSDGASVQGVASLYNWDGQPDYAIPYKYGGRLFWRTPDQWADESSLDWHADGNGNAHLEVMGASAYAGAHSRHYFGTSADKSAALGWHELPNVTTNAVRGDEITISSNPSVPGYTPPADGGEKLFGLRGWNYSHSGDPLFVVNVGGGIAYIPLPSITNLAACACTGKWASATAWIGDGAKVSEGGGLDLPGGTMDAYLSQTLGYLYSTTPGNLHFNNENGGLTASFGAPTNWADGRSLEAKDGEYQIKDFASASACAAPLSSMLSNPSSSDSATHLLLAKKTDSGELHYVRIGDGVTGGAPVDDATITTNAASGAASAGVASLYGWATAGEGTTPVRRGDALSWETPASALKVVGNYDSTEAVCTNKLVLRGSGIEFRVVESDGSVEVTAIPVAVGNLGFDPVTKTIRQGYAIVARTPVLTQSHTVSAAGYVYLEVDHSTTTPTATVVSGSSWCPSATDTKTYIPLYYIGETDGSLTVWQDYRGAPQIQLME